MKKTENFIYLSISNLINKSNFLTASLVINLISVVSLTRRKNNCGIFLMIFHTFSEVSV